MTSPAAHGSLEDRPIASLLVYALDTHFTGSLVLGEDTIVYFENGRACLAHPARPLDDDLPPGARAAARVAQLEAQILSLVSLPSHTSFALYFDVNLVPGGDDAVCSPCDPLPLIVDAIRLRPDALPIGATLQRFSSCIISVNPDAPIRDLGFRMEQRIVDALEQRPRTLRELVEEEVTNPTVAMVALYALAVTRCVRFGRTQVPPLSTSRHTSDTRHDSYPPPRTSGFFEQRPARIPRRGKNSAA